LGGDPVGFLQRFLIRKKKIQLATFNRWNFMGAREYDLLPEAQAKLSVLINCFRLSLPERSKEE
jgi:hypothetical protein